MQYITGIPWWVYLLFGWLLYIGIKRCQTHIISVKKIIILPVLFAYLSISGLMQSASSSVHIWWIYALTCFIGIGLGFLHIRNKTVRADKKQHLVEIPGDWTMLFLIMVIFFSQFTIQYLIALGEAFTHTVKFLMLTLAISGLTLGMIIGRNGCYFYKYRQASHTDLTEK